jgi:hypothetical protein
MRKIWGIIMDRFQIFGIAMGVLLIAVACCQFFIMVLAGNKDAFWLMLIFAGAGIGFILWSLPNGKESPLWLAQLPTGRLFITVPLTAFLFSWAYYWPINLYQWLAGGMGTAVFLWEIILPFGKILWRRAEALEILGISPE